MDKDKLKKFLKEEIRRVLGENPKPQISPEKPQTKPVKEPGEKEPEKPKRRTLNPPEHSPDTKPKAKLKESEKAIVDKIVQRFKKLK